MNHNEIRIAVIAKLQANGVDIDRRATVEAVRIAVETATGIKPAHRQRPSDYIAQYIAAPRQERYRPAFRAKVVHKHPRLVEINQGQPPMLTPCGTGNYKEFSKEWGNQR